MQNSKVNSELGENKGGTSTLKKRKTQSQFKNKLKTLVENPKKKKEKKI